MMEFSTVRDTENIRFLYDKRLTLFNTRREHEWKIYFGAMALVGGVDAALVTRGLVLGGWLWYGWIAASHLPPEQQKSLFQTLRGLPSKALETVIIRALEMGIERPEKVIALITGAASQI